MAEVTNLSDQAISISPYFLPPRMQVKKGTQEEEINPESRQSISDEIMRPWAAKPLNATAIADRRVTVEFGDAVKPVAVVAPVEDTGGKEHYMKTISRIKTIDQVDTLEAMYAAEERPKVREALEARIGEIA